MYRKPDWEARLAAYLEPLRTRAFEWGAHDCCTFTSGAVKAMTGVDPMVEFRGHQIVKMTVTEAHTYVSNSILSHNIKMNQNEQIE